MKVLYAHSSAMIGGGNKVLLGLFEGLDRSRYSPVSVLPEPGPLEDDLRRLDVPYFVLDLRPGGRSKSSLAGSVGRLSVEILRRRIGMVHANDPISYRIASLAARSCLARRVCTVHHPGQTAESLGWSFRCRPHLVLTPSYFMRGQVSDCLNGRDRPRLEVVWNQVDTDWFCPAGDPAAAKAALGLDPAGFDVSILAALAPHKGHECFLRAAALILRRLPATTFHIVGGTRPGNEAYEESLHRLAAGLGIAGRVRFRGFVGDEQARDILRASDLSLLPSREEGFGLSVAEAQSCQVPVLVSDLPVLREVVSHGQTGYLIDPDDPPRFAERAVDLLLAPADRKAMGSAGRRWVIERFGRPAHIRRTMALYAELN